MKTIGMIGGSSWHSTVEYYRIINEAVNRKLGDQHSARIMLSSVDFQELVDLADGDDWKGIGAILAREAKKLEGTGVDFFIICANTLHRVADIATAEVAIPLLHVADAVGKAIKSQGLDKMGLLGTNFMIKDGFYQAKLSQHGIEALVPDEASITAINDIIFDELVKGTIRGESRDECLEIVDSLIERGAQGIILGCTEIPLLIKQEHTPIPLFDTTQIHAEAAARMALE
jgi:aspartate racemase